MLQPGFLRVTDAAIVTFVEHVFPLISHGANKYGRLTDPAKLYTQSDGLQQHSTALYCCKYIHRIKGYQE